MGAALIGIFVYSPDVSVISINMVTVNEIILIAFCTEADEFREWAQAEIRPENK